MKSAMCRGVKAVTGALCPLLLGACSAAGLFSKDTVEAIDRTKTGPLSYVVKSTAERPELAERLAAHALKCWVRQDPTYRVGGPALDGALHRLSLVRKGLEDGAKPVEALRLELTDAPDGLVQIDASGPLATATYDAKIRDGIRRAAIGNSDCR